MRGGFQLHNEVMRERIETKESIICHGAGTSILREKKGKFSECLSTSSNFRIYRFEGNKKENFHKRTFDRNILCCDRGQDDILPAWDYLLSLKKNFPEAPTINLL